MKKGRVMGRWFLSLVLLALSHLTLAQEKGEPLLAKVYAGGSLSLEDEGGLLGVLEPGFITLAGQETRGFSGGSSNDPDHFDGAVSLEGGGTLALQGFIRPTRHGLQVHYDLTPSRTLSLKQVFASLALPYDDWVGARCQNGFYALQVAPNGILFNGELKEKVENPRYQCFTVLGPGPSRPKFLLKTDGIDELSPCLMDDRREKQPFLEIRMVADRPGEKKSVTLEAGVKRVLEFELSLSRPVSLLPGLQPASEFAGLKKKMENRSAGAFPLPTIEATPKPVDSLKAWRKPPPGPDYSVPQDAQSVDMYVDDTLGQPHFYVPVTFKCDGKSVAGWLFWDTGWKSDCKDKVDLQVSTDLLTRMGFTAFKTRSAQRKYVDVSSGKGKVLDVRQYYVSNDIHSDVGPKAIEADLGAVHLDDLHLVADSSVDDVVRFGNKYFSFKKQEMKVLGAITAEFMKEHLISYDFKNQKIYIRPLDAKRRTFFEGKPLGQVDYKLLDDIVFLPVTLNEGRHGWAQLDTGSPFAGLDATRLDPCLELPLRSFLLGQYELGPKFKDHPPMFWRTLSNIASIGNDVLSDLFVTLDPQDRIFYIERDGGTGSMARSGE